MTDRELNTEVAKILGWTDIFLQTNELGDRLFGTVKSPEDFFGTVYPVPNFCNNLDKIHEAESRALITKQLQIDFVENLTYIVETGFFEDYSEAYIAIHSTARQRCEALIATFSK